MDALSRDFEALSDTSLYEQAKAIADFYDSIRDAFTPFQNEFSIHCKGGCGECCAHFVPDLTSSEALIIALYLHTSWDKEEVQKLLEDNMENTLGPCPFYNAESSYHCRIYEVRPLVCRLFGSAVVNTKKGRVFRRCRFIASKEMPKELDEDVLSAAASEVPLMSRYGTMLEELAENSADTELMPTAVRKALSRLTLILSLKSCS